MAFQGGKLPAPKGIFPGMGVLLVNASGKGIPFASSLGMIPQGAEAFYDPEFTEEMLLPIPVVNHALVGGDGKLIAADGIPEFFQGGGDPAIEYAVVPEETIPLVSGAEDRK